MNATAIDILFLTVPARPSTVDVKEVMMLGIGLMIEMYVLTRMIEVIISRNKRYFVPFIVQILAGITIAVCVLGAIMLFNLWVTLGEDLYEI
ncbi:MAG: hypothetical protein AB1589_13145 [Cyanobacteriota bacterium]